MNMHFPEEDISDQQVQAKVLVISYDWILKWNKWDIILHLRKWDILRKSGNYQYW